MYFNQLATPTATHLSMNQHQTIPKNKATTNPYQHQKKKKKKKNPNPPININQQSLVQQINLKLPE